MDLTFLQPYFVIIVAVLVLNCLIAYLVPRLAISHGIRSAAPYLAEELRRSGQ